MSVTTSYPFTTPANYTYGNAVEVTGGNGQLTIGTTGLEFTEDFADDTGFTYDSNIAEFNGEDFPEATFGANYTSGIDGNWGDGVLTGTGSGGASVAGGKLVLDQSDVRYVDYAGAGNADVLVDEGCIRFKVTPDYSGTPAANIAFFTVSQADSNDNNEILVYHLTGTGNLGMRIRDAAGVAIFTQTFFAAWNPTASTEYVIEVSFDVVNGFSTMFVDGTISGTIQRSVGTRSSSIGLLRIGSENTGAQASDFSIDDFMIFDKPQHWATHTISYTVGDTNALAGVYQKKSITKDCACFANFTVDEDLNYGRGTVTGTLTNATVAGGLLDCTGGGVKYCSWGIAKNADYAQVGAIKFKITPQYSGTPAGIRATVFQGDTASINNRLQMRHMSGSGNLEWNVTDSAGVAIDASNFGAWSPTASQEYEFEINYDFTNGATRLFIDGVQQGATMVGTGTRDATAMNTLRLGADRTGADSQDAYFDDLVVYDKVQHTAGYTSGYTLYSNLYAEQLVTLPTMTYAGDQNIAAWEDFSMATEVGSPRYIFNGNYWNGGAWVASSDTYATAASSALSNTNIPTLTKADTMIVDAVFQGSGTVRSGCDTGVVGYSDAQYSEDDPTIVPTTAIYTEGLSAFTATVSAAGADAVKFVLTVDGIDTYWDGGAWSASAGYAQSNTAAEINTNAAALNCTGGKTIYIKVYLHSNDGSTSPSIDTMAMTYDYYGVAPGDPNTCVVYGYLKNADGTASVGAAISAKLTDIGLYNGNITVTQKIISTTTNASGYWELTLIENSNMAGSLGYEFHTLASGLDKREEKVVPNQAGANYSSLADL